MARFRAFLALFQSPTSIKPTKAPRHGVSTPLQSHHHLRDHGQYYPAGPVASSADHAAADRRQRAGGGGGGGFDRPHPCARSRNRPSLDVDRSLSRCDGPHPREESQANHQPDDRAGRAVRAFRGRPEGRRPRHHADGAGKARRACRNPQARNLYARSQHHEFRRAGRDQHAAECAQDGGADARRPARCRSWNCSIPATFIWRAT